MTRRPILQQLQAALPFDLYQSPSAKLLEPARDLIRLQHYSIRTEQAYLGWIGQYIIFHKKRHPSELENYRRELRPRFTDALLCRQALKN